MRALILSVGARLWAVRLDQTREVMVTTSLTPIPGAPPSVLGLCHRRGDVLAVLSLPTVLGLGPPSAEARAAAWLVVVDAGQGVAGLAVTRIPELRELGEPVGSGDGPAVLSVHRLDDEAAGPRTVGLLDTDAALTPVRIGQPQ